jgi:histidinol dehydrogenase
METSQDKGVILSRKFDQILISYTQPDFNDRLRKLCDQRLTLGRLEGYDSNESRKVVGIIRDVEERGDNAVSDWTLEFDKVKLLPEEFRVSESEMKKAHSGIDKKLLSSICQAIDNVRKYQKGIFICNKKENEHPGIKYSPIKRVGIWIPGASAPLPSTVIMTAVPAQVAGVEKIVVVSPPRYKGTIHPVTLAVCYELKIDEVYRAGGVPAIATLASDKGTIPRVDKIVGPGNKYVQTAKKMVSGDYVAIDSVAGPSEVLIIADDNAKPEWVAADMLSQAEHGLDSTAVVFTESQKLADSVIDELERQLAHLDRTQEAENSLIKFAGVVVFKDMESIIDETNDFAAEHLHIQCGGKSSEIADKIENAGAIFIGQYSPVAVGDYWAGPSHTLPTGQTAKFFSALSANDFIKSTSIIEYTKKQLAESADDIIRLAMVEGLDAHARSVQIRMQR